MANPEHLEILKQGVDAWNKWREETNINPDLEAINFKGASLNGVNFIRANLSATNLEGVSLEDANLGAADLSFASLIRTNLSRASLFQARTKVTFFSSANLKASILIGVIFEDCVFENTNFDTSKIGDTTFSNCGLGGAKGLESVEHIIASTIGIDTIYKSGGKIPEIFLRGCGVPETFITYAKSLVENPIEYYSCFISFTEKDDAFSERLYNDMQMAGIRCWRWKEDAKWGRTLRKEIDEAVRYYDKLVVICSKESLNAPAVLEEIERALDKEDMLKRKGDEGEVLFPIAIDRYIFDEWEHELKVRLMRKTIGNFYDCGSDPEKYRRSVERLVKNLNRPRK